MWIFASRRQSYRKKAVVGQDRINVSLFLYPKLVHVHQPPTIFIHQITLFMTKTGINDQGDKLNVTVYLDQFPLTGWLIGLAVLIAVAGKDFEVK